MPSCKGRFTPECTHRWLGAYDAAALVWTHRPPSMLTRDKHASLITPRVAVAEEPPKVKTKLDGPPSMLLRALHTSFREPAPLPYSTCAQE